VPHRTMRNGWKRWSEDDLRQLRELARAELPKELIGLRMGRSPEAVAQRAWVEGIALAGRRSRAGLPDPLRPWPATIAGSPVAGAIADALTEVDLRDGR
jgi:hypothetical protein